jgi:hypothetical protein
LPGAGVGVVTPKGELAIGRVRLKGEAAAIVELLRRRVTTVLVYVAGGCLGAIERPHAFD